VSAAVNDHEVAETQHALRDVLEGGAGAVERIVRTETAFAYNAANDAAIIEYGRVDRRMMKRWTELVDDATGQPLDKRVGIDSVVLHAQVTRPDGVFTMPPDPRAPGSMVGRAWSHPPNRANDRAVIVPWHPSWGLPGWQWIDGRRVWLGNAPR
jgi:hypothetical protein